MAAIVIVFGFLSLLALVIGLPVTVTKLKAKGNSAEISFKDAWGLTLRKTGKENLLKAFGIVQQSNLNVSLTQLETHMLAGGDPLEVVNALNKNKEKPGVNFKILSALNLAGKDLEKLIEKGFKPHQIKIKDFKFQDFKADYEATYKYGLSIAFRDDENFDLKQRIEEKLNSISQNWISKDPIQTQNFIRQNILNNEYWEKVLNANLIEQNLQIKL